MIGSFLTRGLVMVFGYAYPAYECYKTVEMNKPDIEQLRFWCQYWILVAMLTVCERVGDTFISWVPMYSEAKLAFFIYLWFPKTKGTTYVYESFFKPLVSEHEPEIDRSLLELRIRAGDMAVLYWQKALSYGQTRIFDILQYIASQSTPPPRPVQQPTQQEAGRVQPTTSSEGRKRAATTALPPVEEPHSPSSSMSSSEKSDDAVEEVGPPQEPTDTSKALKTTATQSVSETIKASTSNDKEVLVVDSVPSSTSENAKPSQPPEIMMEDTVVVTRARLRKTRSTTVR
ncbi:OLC1v1018210C1 [Oldenlandia corymbosa var. corymbosa]|uniref:HVA22-like protein n=1 Tax=Oldenlandia corymbosa var. corymbosa TaxID=529605 RepID=A0AAV1EBE5_OLDCO|nr:OLC1v1018210C1 [Oldenlandia corymbosa var. corymbosa]